jgi:TIGR03009 family protein
MVRYGIVVAVWSGAVAFAQSPAVPVPGSGQPGGVQPGGIPVAAPQAQPDPKLVAHLMAWEKRMKELDNLMCDVDKTEQDNVLKREMKKVGKIFVMKPNYAWMRLDRAPGMPADPNDFQTWISDGKSIYEYMGRTKEMVEFKLSPNGGIQGNLLFEFMSGSITTAGALRRFDMKLLGQDTNYVHIEIKPTLPNDRTEFETMVLTFVSPEIAPQFQHLRYLPASVRMNKNGNRESEIWQFTRNAQVNLKNLTADQFRKQTPPADWKVTQGNAAPQAGSGPRIGRP